MARKNTLEGSQVITAQSMGADVTSAITCIQWLDNITYQCNFTGTPTGTFSVHGSVDHQEVNNVVVRAGTFVPITLDPSPVASGSAGSVLINLNQLAFPYIKLVYTRTSSTGTLNAYISGKEI